MGCKNFDALDDMCRCCLSGGTSVNPKEQKCKDVLDDRWVEFKNHMEQLHEMQDEGCRGCERPETDCRKCMQDYYWLNIKYYL